MTVSVTAEQWTAPSGKVYWQATVTRDGVTFKGNRFHGRDYAVRSAYNTMAYVDMRNK